MSANLYGAVEAKTVRDEWESRARTKPRVVANRDEFHILAKETVQLMQRLSDEDPETLFRVQVYKLPMPIDNVTRSL